MRLCETPHTPVSLVSLLSRSSSETRKLLKTRALIPLFCPVSPFSVKKAGFVYSVSFVCVVLKSLLGLGSYVRLTLFLREARHYAVPDLQQCITPFET